MIQVTSGFLGVLEMFLVKSEHGIRTYDFTAEAFRRRREELKERRRAVGTPPISLPGRLLGPASWSELSLGQRGIIDCLIREVTRDRNRNSEREDRAQVVRGNRVPGAKPKSKVTCPLLDARGSYVAFGGNGKLPGMGYRIVGQDDRGWMYKAGFEIADGIAELMTQIRRFLQDLGAVAEILGLTVAALEPNTGEWYSLEDLIVTARGRSSFEVLDPLHLRIYGPEDYLDRLRSFFAEKGSFTSIPGGSPPQARSAGTADAGEVGPLSMAARMRRAGVTHQELADHLGRERSVVTRMLNKQITWPNGLKQRAEAYVSSIEASH
jgi:hypothetical protein